VPRRVPTNHLNCDDCGENTYYEYYVVRDELWREYGSEWMLCVGCLERRMGRHLVTDDFTDANFDPRMLNNGRHPKSERLISRLTSSGEWHAEPIPKPAEDDE
jgi:hypothetical protein